MGIETITTLIVLLITAIVSPIIAYKIATKKTKNDFYNKALQNRYKLVYAPLRALLLETHITGASRGFYFSQRLRRSLPYFMRFNFKKGFQKLSKSFGADPLYEVEFGADFPLENIKKIIQKQGKWADSKLLNLVQSADRSSYESRAYRIDGKSNGLLEIEKFRLAKHIWDTYEKLNKRLLPKP